MRTVPALAVPGAPTPELSIDLLVPSLDGHFGYAQHGGRGFDAAPGLAPALASDPIELDVGATLLDDTVLELTVVIKAYAYASRLQTRDIEDPFRRRQPSRRDTSTSDGLRSRCDHLVGWRAADPR